MTKFGAQAPGFSHGVSERFRLSRKSWEVRQTCRFARAYKKLHDNVAADVDAAIDEQFHQAIKSALQRVLALAGRQRRDAKHCRYAERRNRQWTASSRRQTLHPQKSFSVNRQCTASNRRAVLFFAQPDQ